MKKLQNDSGGRLKQLKKDLTKKESDVSKLVAEEQKCMKVVLTVQNEIDTISQRRSALEKQF